MRLRRRMRRISELGGGVFPSYIYGDCHFLEIGVPGSFQWARETDGSNLSVDLLHIRTHNSINQPGTVPWRNDEREGSFIVRNRKGNLLSNREPDDRRE